MSCAQTTHGTISYMSFPVQKIPCLPLLKEIPDPPETLYVRGTLPTSDTTYLSIVGSRNYTDYGARVIEDLLQGLRGHNICIVSGLALGIDARAHEAALKNNLHTIAVPGSGINDTVLYPKTNQDLAHRILESGGALLSEFEPTFRATKWSFPKRNRIMAGMSHAVLLIEAAEKSGTLITARMAVDYNRDVLVVPGNIFSKNSHGVHQFLKLGATPITSSEDIVDALSFDRNINT
jgi:DNA processing protein